MKECITLDYNMQVVGHSRKVKDVPESYFGIRLGLTLLLNYSQGPSTFRGLCSF
jgi:hypothetical protein